MIAVINVEITAANPSMPLFPWRAYVNSPSSLRIRNVPRRVGNWNIDKVYVSAAYPDNSVKSAECVLVGGVWVCTITGSASTGFSQNGYTIFADGKDENGNEVTGYVLGKGDITILESDGTITPGETTYYVHMLSAQPTAPKDGDLWQLSGSWYIYQDGTAYPIGDDSGLISQLSTDVENLQDSVNSIATDVGQMGQAINDITLSVENLETNKADVASLTAYELTANMQSDVSSIVLSVDEKPSGWYGTPTTYYGEQIKFSIDGLGTLEPKITPYTDRHDVIGNSLPYHGQDATYVWTNDWNGWYDEYDHTPLSAKFQQGYSRNALGLAMASDLSSLPYYELTANMQSDVSSIVLSTETSESWDFQFPQGATEYNYQILQFDYYDSDMMWLLRINVEDVGDFDWYSYQPPTDTNIVFGEGTGFDSFGAAYATKHTTARNALGLAMESDLSSKQDKLSDPQISAIDSVVDERATVITFTDNTTSAFNWSGTITRYTMIDAGLFDEDDDGWIKSPASVKIGTAVTVIGEYAFGFAFNLSNVTIPDGVTSIENYAFYNCEGLTSVTIPNNVTSIGESAFEDCSGLTSATMLDNGLHNLKTIGAYAFKGCTNLQSITLPQGIESIGVDAFADNYTYFKLYLTEAVPTFVPYIANYHWGISNTANIITVRNASKEWVEEQAYGKGFVWRNASVNPRLHTCDMFAFNINAVTINSAQVSFKVKMNATAYTTARDLYFALTIGNFTQPMTWDTPFDMFEGGSAEAIAPKPNTTNIYHIFEYASGHFMVEKVI